MKNLILSFSALFITLVSYAQVGIGVTTPHASAALEVVATNNDKGILITRLTKSQRDAISAPATGLLVYQTDNSPGLYFFNGISWAAVGKDNLGNHLLTQSLNLNGEAIKDNTDDSTELTIQSLVNDKDVHIKSYDEIYLTTINGDDGVTQDPLGTVYDTYGDIELESADDIILTANKYVKLIANGDDNDLSIELNADQDIELYSGDDILIDANDIVTISNGDNIILNSGNDIELKVTSGDFVEIWENGDFLYTLPGSRGNVGQFMQRSSDGSAEYFSDWSAYALPTTDGDPGQILTTDGSGTVSWATLSGGASSLNDLSDAITYGTGSFSIGHSTTGVLNDAQYNIGIGSKTNQSITSGDYNIAVGLSALEDNTEGRDNTAIGTGAGSNLKGSKSVSFNNASSNNVLMGTNAALEAETTTNNNVFIGSNVARYITQVSKSVFLGDYAGEGNINSPFAIGERNIYIGAYNNASAANVDGEIVIGADAVGNGSNTITLGHTTNTAVYARGTVYSNSTALTSDRRLKTDIKSVANGLSTVMKLNPVSYNKRLSFDTEEYNKKEIGFIAQEVQEILPDLVSEGPDENKTLNLNYNSLIPILTKAIQEQQVLIEALKAKVERLESNN